MKVFRYPITITGFAVIKADCEAEARMKASELLNNLPVSGLQYDDPRLPEISLGEWPSVRTGEPIEIVETEAPRLPGPSVPRIG